MCTVVKRLLENISVNNAAGEGSYQVLTLCLEHTCRNIVNIDMPYRLYLENNLIILILNEFI